MGHRNQLSVGSGLEGALALLFSANPIPMWIVDRDTLEFLAVNQAATESYGYSKEEFLGMKVTDIRPTEDLPRFMMNLESTRFEGDQGEWRHVLKDGRVIYVEINSHWIEFRGRNAVLVVCKDITDWKRAEAALREAEERYRIISELTTEYMASVGFNEDGSLRFEWLTDSVSRDYGWTLDDFNSQESPLSIVHVEDLPYAMAALDRVVRGERVTGEIRTRGKNGRTRWVRFYIQPVVDEATGRVTRFIGAGKNVTGQRDSTRRLAQSEDQFRKIAENLKQVLWLRTADMSRFLYVSRSFEEVWGMPLRRLYEDPHLWLDAVLPDDKQNVERDLARTLPGPFDREFRIVRPDGEIRWLRARGIPITDPLAEDNLVAGITEDITDARAEVESKLEREARIRILLKQVPAIIWTTDENLIFTAGMGSHLKTLGLAEIDLRGIPVADYFEARGPGHPALKAHRRALSGEPTNFEIDWGNRSWKTYLEPLRDPEGRIRGVVGVALDVTEAVLSRRHLEEAVERLEKSNIERKLLVERLVEIQEDERRRVAADLHDELGQVLTSASLFIRSVQTASPESRPEILASLGALLEESVASVRRIAWNLRSPALDEGGLGAAIELLVEQTRSLHSIQIEIESMGSDRRLSLETETAVYRIVQEAMTNIVKHSGASSASTILKWSETFLDVLIEDDGKGFEVKSLTDAKSRFGLSGMRERALLMGADLVIDSSPGAGTMIRLRVPA